MHLIRYFLNIIKLSGKKQVGLPIYAIAATALIAQILSNEVLDYTTAKSLASNGLIISNGQMGKWANS